jgi:hypothetical protein
LWCFFTGHVVLPCAIARSPHFSSEIIMGRVKHAEQ